MTPEPTTQSANGSPDPVRHLEFKAAMLLMLMVALVVGSALYVMYARGRFERSVWC